LLEDILRSKIKPKARQNQLVEAVVRGDIPMTVFMEFIVSASDTDKGACADVIKHISEQKPELLAPYLDTLFEYIHYQAPRVKWGILEAIGNLARLYPESVAVAIPDLIQNTAENETNTTVIRWCAAYALAEIAKSNPQTREQLLPFFEQVILSEANNGVKNVYLQAIKTIRKQSQTSAR
jgi:hypothetical protein